MDDSRDDERGTLRPAAARFGASALGLVRTRLELASVEFAEERERLQIRVALTIAGILAILFGVMTLGALVIIWFWDSYRYSAVIGVAVVLVGSGVLLLRQGRNVGRHGAPPFEATLAELEKDRAWLVGGASARHPGDPS